MSTHDRAGETQDRGKVKVCPRCGEPVVFTFEFRGAEHYCVECEWKGGIFDANEAAATPARVARFGELEDRYEVESAARRGLPAPEPPSQDGPRPTCSGCGVVAVGPMRGDKPAHWFSRTRDGVTEFACSRECIPSNQAVMPW